MVADSSGCCCTACELLACFIPEVVEANGHLNQSRIEFAVCFLIVRPEFFPRVMGLEKLAVVEVFDPLQVPGVVIGGIHRFSMIRHHGSLERGHSE